MAFMVGVVVGYLVGVFVMAFRAEWQRLKDSEDA